MPPLQIPNNAAMVRRGDLVVTPVWLAFFTRLAGMLGPDGPAGADAPYILATPDASLPNARVATDSPSIDFDLGTPAQLKAHVIPAGLDGMCQFNDAGDLGGQWMPQFGRWQPVTSGDPLTPGLVFNSEGDVVMVWVPA